MRTVNLLQIYVLRLYQVIYDSDRGDTITNYCLYRFGDNEFTCQVSVPRLVSPIIVSVFYTV